MTRNIAEIFQDWISILQLDAPAYLSRTAVWRRDNASGLLRNFLSVLRQSA